MLRSPNLFPALILTLYAGAAIRYAFAADWARVVYWIAASTLTTVVTWFLR